MCGGSRPSDAARTSPGFLLWGFLSVGGKGRGLTASEPDPSALQRAHFSPAFPTELPEAPAARPAELLELLLQPRARRSHPLACDLCGRALLKQPLGRGSVVLGAPRHLSFGKGNPPALAGAALAAEHLPCTERRPVQFLVGAQAWAMLRSQQGEAGGCPSMFLPHIQVSRSISGG